MTQNNSQDKVSKCESATVERYRRAVNHLAAVKAEELIVKYKKKITDHGVFIRREGIDPPEIAEWRWAS